MRQLEDKLTAAAAAAARHIPGVSGHELSLAANRHFSIPALSKAIAELVNAHARLDIYQVWGDGSAVAADGAPPHRRVTGMVSCPPLPR
ncbi:Tn3 family transposase [Streptomyces niveiscabiei]|uniref:Tn3 family transposase n=1 Tax=Streptomyces niveiscabiei TaxID=164115 RepID=A0ABW9I9E5_9ACTN